MRTRIAGVIAAVGVTLAACGGSAAEDKFLEHYEKNYNGDLSEDHALAFGHELCDALAGAQGNRVFMALVPVGLKHMGDGDPYGHEVATQAAVLTLCPDQAAKIAELARQTSPGAEGAFD